MNEREQVKAKMLENFKPDWFDGWHEMCEYINYWPYHTDLQFSRKYHINELIAIARELRDEGKIEVRPMWTEDGLLNGNGWFLKK